MRIRMVTTQRGSPDGVTLTTYEAGTVYVLDGTEREQDLAAVFVREGWAVDAAVKPTPVSVSLSEEHAKSIRGKALRGAPENKAKE